MSEMTYTEDLQVRFQAQQASLRFLLQSEVQAEPNTWSLIVFCSFFPPSAVPIKDTAMSFENHSKII